VNSLILDASVAAKWFFPEEGGAQSALGLKDDFISKKISISVPDLIYYEINNLLKSAIKSNRADKDKAKEAYRGFLELDFIVYASKQLMEDALDLAITYDISSCDASYISLSRLLKVPLYTADKKLLSKISSKLIRGLHSYT
jgi:predicted nucleic acid-binding protein